MEKNPLRKLMRERRAELGKMTQEQAAELAGCDKATWNRWESESYAPREERFPAIARALDLDIEDLRRAFFEQLQGALGEVSVKLKLDGPNPAEPFAAYEFKNEGLKELNKKLDTDFSRIENDTMQVYLSDWRSVLRGQLINADILFQSHQQSVGIYRRFVIALLGLPRSLFRGAGKKAKVKPKKDEKSSKDGEECE